MTPAEYDALLHDKGHEVVEHITHRWRVDKAVAEELAQRVFMACAKPGVRDNITPNPSGAIVGLIRFADRLAMNHVRDQRSKATSELYYTQSDHHALSIYQYHPEYRHRADYEACKAFVREKAMYHAIGQLPPPYPDLFKATLEGTDLKHYATTHGWSTREYKRYSQGMLRHRKHLREAIELSLLALGWDDWFPDSL